MQPPPPATARPFDPTTDENLPYWTWGERLVESLWSTLLNDTTEAWPWPPPHASDQKYRPERGTGAP